MRCPTCTVEIDDEHAASCPACSALLSSPTASAFLAAAPTHPPNRLVEHPANSLRSGTLVAGRYRVVRHLRSGGMGTVYQADDLKLNVPVALKFLSASDAGDERLELLLNEVRLAREITHPNVCRLFDVGEIDGLHFLSMEYVEGEDLASLLHRIGRLPKDKAVTIGFEICEGIAAAHRQGILHRDLKPANLMVDANGHAKIMDFGLAVFGRSPDGHREIAGTPDYMAPEQRRGLASVQTDIHAVGLVLYELLTGRKAHRDLALGDSTDLSPMPAAVANDIDPAVERIIRHCLEPDPGLRPSSMSAVAATLAALAAPPWRPAEGLEIPHRQRWRLERQLGRGGFGETWLAVHRKTRDSRVFKFCYDASKLKTFQREITLFRFMRETLGGRDDIAAILDWQLDDPPFFIESEFAPTGNLIEWSHKEGGPAAIPFSDRVDIVRRMAVALSAAHSVGVLHKDVKPANVLVQRRSDGSLQARLCDFGVGMLTEKERLQAAGVTAIGFTDTTGGGSLSDAGTRLYMAPEVMEGKPPTTGADVYALGVVLYQMAAGDLTKALAPGWDRDIADGLLREDISAAVDGAPDRRVSAAQLADRLSTRDQREANRKAVRESEDRARRGEQAARRRRNLVTGVLCALLTAGLGLGLAFERAESYSRQALIDQTLRSNEAMVRLAAAAVGDKLEAAIRRVKEEAADPYLREQLVRIRGGIAERERPRIRETLRRHLEQVLASAKPQEFDSWAVSDADALVWARAPHDPLVIDRNYRYREWFNGRLELPPDAQIEAVPRTETGFSLAFKSTAQGAPLLIGLASPVLATPGDEHHGPPAIVGVLNAGIHLETFNAWLAIAENRPQHGGCPDRFVLLMHRDQLLRHPCPAPDAAPLPVAGFTSQSAVMTLFSAPERSATSFLDPMRTTRDGPAAPALAVAQSPASLSQWTLVLQQDVDAALRPITALTDDFRRPARIALFLGFGALVLLLALLWRDGQWRLLLRPSASGPRTNEDR